MRASYARLRWVSTWVGAVCCGMLVSAPVTARAAAAAATAAPVVINVVVTLTTVPGTAAAAGGSPVAGSGSAPVAGSGSAPVAGSGSAPVAGSGGGGSSSGSAGATCASSYPQAIAAMNTVVQLLQQMGTIYATDHAAGRVTDTSFNAGQAVLLGIGLDAGAAHDMIQIGGDAADISAEIATVQGEIAGVTNADLLALIGQVQASLTGAAALVQSSANCPVSVAQ